MDSKLTIIVCYSQYSSNLRRVKISEITYYFSLYGYLIEMYGLGSLLKIFIT